MAPSDGDAQSCGDTSSVSFLDEAIKAAPPFGYFKSANHATGLPLSSKHDRASAAWSRHASAHRRSAEAEADMLADVNGCGCDGQQDGRHQQMSESVNFVSLHNLNIFRLSFPRFFFTRRWNTISNASAAVNSAHRYRKKEDQNQRVHIRIPKAFDFVLLKKTDLCKKQLFAWSFDQVFWCPHFPSDRVLSPEHALVSVDS